MIITLLSAALLGALGSPQAPEGAAKPPERLPLIDLAKAPMHREKEKWLGKAIDSVLSVSSVSRVLLLTAETSATADIDAANIRRLLSSHSQFERPPSGWESSPVIWQAVLETDDGRVFHLRVLREWAQLVSLEAHGFFRVR